MWLTVIFGILAIGCLIETIKSVIDSDDFGTITMYAIVATFAAFAAWYSFQLTK